MCALTMIRLCCKNATMLSLLLASKAWARYEDLWGEPEYDPGRFSDATQALIYALISCGVALFLVWEKGGWRKWLMLASLAAILPVYVLWGEAVITLCAGPVALGVIWIRQNPSKPN